MHKEEMTRPVIGILADVFFVNEPEWSNGQYKNYINQSYVESIHQSGGIPLLLPVTETYDEEVLKTLLLSVDGILLPGGDDIAPYFYGEDVHPHMGYFLSNMDMYHIQAAKLAYEYGKPIFGICRGMQIINIVFGGTLYQDLPSEREEILQHVQMAPRHEGAHYIHVQEGSFLGNCFGKEKVLVNTFHHQAVKKLAPKFKVTAETADGVIEGIELQEEIPVIGVQWHPEALMAGGREDQKKLFQQFIHLCRHKNA